MLEVSYQEAVEVGRRLLRWYMENKRDLPWRRTKDPYKIWVSEVMLQQTRVETVIPYWNRFMERYPTVEALATAPEEEVLKLWEGLGYYSRVRNLQTAVREVHANYGGRVPDTLEEISSLSGVGPYTAGAVLSIAYNVPVPAVDGNVFRVLSRLFLIEDDVSKPAARRKFESLAEFLIPPGEASNFNQSLMELGAKVCIPKYPRCPECPLQEVCRAHAEGMQEDLPVKGKKKPPKPIDIATGIVWNGDKVMVVRRPLTGLLAGMWEFPGGEVAPGDTHQETLQRILPEKYAQPIEIQSHFADVQHTFSHLHWNLKAFSCSITGDSCPDAEAIRWLNVWQLSDVPMPVAHQKLAKALQGLV
ncbi:A/G-specific adenine glycosylase [Effusibacillus lacus]|uniref:Adenine DNA glycosylase n=1 Tax=Effusibacillus lacus TaxID=1348429 RepID=A0A292YRB6_9BACL|nr:A/G-specific adenine glycosylase [Effusibacillus lacus]TCS76975.1 A/G-specific DNA-adenine glycosylase [Effusibacillus lacus]GAX91303.1 A/G-specific adenine glycosylase [Effusibacillus lacus]